MFRLDDVDLDFGDLDDPQPPNIAVTGGVADENDGRISFGFETVSRANSSADDIFKAAESPPAKRRLQESSPVPSVPFPCLLDTPEVAGVSVKAFRPPSASSAFEVGPVATPRRSSATAPSPIVRKDRVKEDGRRSAKKLPGPAGSLPKLRANQDLNQISLSSGEKRKVPAKCSQPSPSQPLSQGDDEPWNMARTTIGPVLWPVFEKYCISKITAQANRRQLSARCKVPCMCLQIDDIVTESVDARVRLKDHSGTMNGTLHREALRSFRDLLKTGSVILLKLVSVFSPTPKTHYLNITRTNLLHVFADSPGPVLPNLTPSVLRQWEAQCSSPPATPPAFSRCPPARLPPGPSGPVPYRPTAPAPYPGPAPYRPPGPAPYRPPGPAPYRPPAPAPYRQSDPAPYRQPAAAPRPSACRAAATGSAQDLQSLLDDGMDDLLVSSMCDEMLADW